MSIQELKQAVTQLPSKDLARFREWFDEFEAQVWDKQFETDAKSGKLEKISEQALNNYRAGKAKEL
ncbi:MAG: hypothetical protein NTW99_12915 [Chloroflexi bacterium]|nr:hypothetical protein [Chloroflexota bacterium]